MNITASPKPDAQPFTSAPENVKWFQEVKAERKAERKAARRSATTQSSQINSILEAMQSQTSAILQSQQRQTQALLEAIKTTSHPAFDWSPVADAATALLNRLVDRIVPPTPTAPTLQHHHL